VRAESARRQVVAGEYVLKVRTDGKIASCSIACSLDVIKEMRQI
jgi:hypothetical protein